MEDFKELALILGSWSDIIFGVPQGSVLGPLLFKVYLSDLYMFFTNSNIAHYADDNSPFSCNKNIESAIVQLENDSRLLFEWFTINGLKANTDRFHLQPRNDIFMEVQQLKKI